MNEVNVLHRMVCNGVVSEMRLLESLSIDEYSATLNAWKYELHLKQNAVKS